MGSSGINAEYMGLQFPLSFGRQNISKPWHSSDTQVLVWPATAGLVLEAGLPLWLSTGMGLSSAEMESTSSTVSARRRGLLRLSPRPGTDGGDTAEPPLLAELLSSDRTLGLQTTPLNRRAPPGDSTGAWSRGMLTLRLTLTMVEPTPDTAMAVLDTAMVVLATVMAVMARGPQTLRLTLTMATVELTLPDTALAVLDTAMVVLATVMAAMARDPQTLRLMPTTAMAVMVDTDSDWLAAMAMVVLATVMAAMARGPQTLRLMPTPALAVMVGTDLDTPLATAMVDTATSDKSAKGCCRELQPMKYAASQN